MSVDDFGIEVLKKAAEEITPGSKAEYVLRVKVTLIAPIPIPGASVINEYDEALAVATNVETDVVSYTVPIGQTLYLAMIESEGQNIAEHFIRENGILIAKKRTHFGADLSTGFDFKLGNIIGYPVAAGNIIKLSVKHERTGSADFSGRIYGVLA